MTDTERLVKLEVHQSQIQKQNEFQTEVLKEILGIAQDIRGEQRDHNMNDERRFREVHDSNGNIKAELTAVFKQVRWLKRIGMAVTGFGAIVVSICLYKVW